MPDRFAKSRSEAKYPGLMDELWMAYNFGVASGSNSQAVDLAPMHQRPNHKGGPHNFLWYPVSASRIRNSGGVGAYFTGYNSLDVLYGQLLTSGTYINNATIVMDLKLDSNSPASNNVGLTQGFGSTVSADAYPWTDGNLYLNALHTSRQTIASNGGFDKSQRHILAFSMRAGSVAGGWRVFQGGKLLSTATSPAANALQFSAAEQEIGRSTVNYHFKGYIYRFYLYGRTLTDQEICRFAPYDNDYDPFTVVPRFKTFIFPEQAAGGGGGFQAAWASRATQIAGVTV